MGVVTVSSSAVRTPVGLNKMHSNRVSSLKMPVILSFKNDENKSTALVAPRESIALPSESNKENRKRLRKVKKRMERINALSTEDASPSTLELDYSEAAEKLEKIYKKSSTTVDFDEDVKTQRRLRRGSRRKMTGENEEIEKKSGENVVRSQRKVKRLNLEKRIALRMKKESEFVESSQKKKHNNNDEDEKIDRLVRAYMASGDFGSLDWKTMKIPPVLPSSEHEWLFTLMQPMKEIVKIKEGLQTDLGREVMDKELAEATNMDVVHLRRQLEVGQAARKKLIKHNLRLVLFVVNKYFHEFADGPRFQDLCQAGVKGLIVAIDRFEPKRKLQLSTYAIFWIRHTIVRFLTISSFLQVPFGLESVRVAIQKAKNDLMFELQRMPTDEEIIKRVGISPERYRDVMRVSQPILFPRDRHPVKQEEFIGGITDLDAVDGDKSKHPALLRLALDDVLDSLKPKESMVIRQRYGLDGKGCRTLGEIAANLNISREMVRKHELKALMKLKHPARVDYLRDYIFN